MSYGIYFPSETDESTPKRFDVICYLYSNRYGSLPPKRIEMCKLISEYLGTSLSDSNKILEGDSLGKEFIDNIHGHSVIYISQNLKSRDEAEKILLRFIQANLKSEIIIRTIDTHRDKVISNLLKL